MIRESRSGITKKVSWPETVRVSVALTMESKQEDDDIVCLDESFFINDDYQLTTFTFGTQVIQLYCLQSASTDFDLTGQLVWPGAMLLNDYLCKNAEMLRGCSVIELGSGAGVTGILCSRFCQKVVLTDHNGVVLKILKKNMEIHASSENSYGYTGERQKLEETFVICQCADELCQSSSQNLQLKSLNGEILIISMELYRNIPKDLIWFLELIFISFLASSWSFVLHGCAGYQ
ncbi:hypothetical protein Nepgr_014882 [Nepenthes gracilis]|uniref:Uncharacterized protein n=1 Tax=Nepenthes gracilis TaxID=150966 RepID=A0AAD3SM07_NEPGR|nr:hypothetical protein Nepgr_014882 [Nepenthes gracilis]